MTSELWNSTSSIHASTSGTRLLIANALPECPALEAVLVPLLYLVYLVSQLLYNTRTHMMAISKRASGEHRPPDDALGRQLHHDDCISQSRVSPKC